MSNNIEKNLKEVWINTCENFENSIVNNYVTCSSVNKDVEMKLLIQDTLDTFAIKKIDIIPWLCKLLPICEKTEGFLTRVANNLGSENYRELNMKDSRSEVVSYSDLNFDEGDLLHREASQLAISENLVEALRKIDSAIEAYEKSFEEFKISRGFTVDNILIIDNNPIAKAYFMKARILVDLNKMDEAFYCQDKAIELDPNNTEYC